MAELKEENKSLRAEEWESLELIIRSNMGMVQENLTGWDKMKRTEVGKKKNQNKTQKDI